MFHTCSCFNVIGIVVFVPFVDRFAQFLRRLFPSDPGERAHQIRHVPPEVPEAAITAIEQEARGAFAAACAINHATLGLPALRVPGATATGLRTDYADLKQLEGEVLRYSVRIPGEQLPESETHQLEQALRSLRASVHAAKSVNDIAHDLDLFANNDDRQIGAALALARRNYADFVTRLFAAVEAQESDDRLVALASLFAQNPRPHRQHRRFEGPCLPRGAGGAASPQRGQDVICNRYLATQGFCLSTDPELDGAHGDIVFTAQFVNRHNRTVVDILLLIGWRRYSRSFLWYGTVLYWYSTTSVQL